MQLFSCANKSVLRDLGAAIFCFLYSFASGDFTKLHIYLIIGYVYFSYISVTVIKPRRGGYQITAPGNGARRPSEVNRLPNYNSRWTDRQTDRQTDGVLNFLEPLFDNHPFGV